MAGEPHPLDFKDKQLVISFADPQGGLASQWQDGKKYAFSGDGSETVSVFTTPPTQEAWDAVVTENGKFAQFNDANPEQQQAALRQYGQSLPDPVVPESDEARLKREAREEALKKIGMPAGRMGRLFPVSGDEVLSCIRTVQRELHVNPDAWQQLLRMAFLRAKVVNSFARQIYPDYPTLLEWSMLRKMMHNWHFPISCLEQNPGAIRGEPKYKAKCFRPGTILPGQADKLYVATGSQRLPMSKEPHATTWLMLRGEQYTATGMGFGRKMLSDLRDQYWDRNIWSQTGQSMEKMYKMNDNEIANFNKYAKDQEQWAGKIKERESAWQRPVWDA